MRNIWILVVGTVNAATMLFAPGAVWAQATVSTDGNTYDQHMM